MFIILDTNIVYSDKLLQSTSIRMLVDSVKKLGGCVCVPKIVLMENKNHIKKSIQQFYSEYKSILRTGKKYVTTIKFPVLDDKFIDDNYNECIKILQGNINKLGIEILPIPSVSHEKVLLRDLAHKKPFTEKGKGYRDALIWENVKLVCKRKIPPLFEKYYVVFITDNSADFCDTKDKNKLHEDLIADLKNESINEDTLNIFPSIDELMNVVIKPKMDRLEDIKNKINKTKVYQNIDFNEIVENIINDKLQWTELNDEESPFGPEYENPTIESINEISYNISDVFLLEDTKSIQIDIDVIVDCNVNFYIYKPDYCLLDEDKMPNIIDFDWNKYYMAAEDSTELQVKISLFYDIDKKAIIDTDLKILPNIKHKYED